MKSGKAKWYVIFFSNKDVFPKIWEHPAHTAQALLTQHILPSDESNPRATLINIANQIYHPFWLFALHTLHDSLNCNALNIPTHSVVSIQLPNTYDEYNGNSLVINCLRVCAFSNVPLAVHFSILVIDQTVVKKVGELLFYLNSNIVYYVP